MPTNSRLEQPKQEDKPRKRNKAGASESGPKKSSGPPSHAAQSELLDYYRQRLDEIEKERGEFMDKLEVFDGSRGLHHQLRVELAKRDTEIRDLQQALSDAHIFLFEEREKVLRLAAENDELRVRELEDRKRIQHLLALTQPVGQEVTYFRSAKPEKVHRNAPVSAESHENRPLSSSRLSQEPHVLRTIYMPSENVDALKSIIDSLRTQLIEQDKLHQDRYRALMEDRCIKAIEQAQRDEKHQKAIQCP